MWPITSISGERLLRLLVHGVLSLWLSISRFLTYSLFLLYFTTRECSVVMVYYYVTIRRNMDTQRQKINMKLMRIFLGVMTVCCLVAVAVTVVHAADYTESGIQGYAAETPIDSGTIVQLAGEEGEGRVKVASLDDPQKMFGVVVDRSRLSVTLTRGLENEVFVATTGTQQVLVSTQGGPIAAGDYLMLSAINGVATRAGEEKGMVFGRAAAPFDGRGVTLGSAPLKDRSGKEVGTVTLGSIPVTIDIRQNPNNKSTKAKVPEALERIGQAIAEKEVSPVRIYISMGITAVSLITALIVLYAGVRNGMISIGRNPMSKRAIFRALLEVILTSALILVIGMFAVYLLLKL